MNPIEADFKALEGKRRVIWGMWQGGKAQSARQTRLSTDCPIGRRTEAGQSNYSSLHSSCLQWTKVSFTCHLPLATATCGCICSFIAKKLEVCSWGSCCNCSKVNSKQSAALISWEMCWKRSLSASICLSLDPPGVKVDAPIDTHVWRSYPSSVPGYICDQSIICLGS